MLKLYKFWLEASRTGQFGNNAIKQQKDLRKNKAKLKNCRSKDKRIPSARNDREEHYNDLSANIATEKVSNSLKRKKRVDGIKIIDCSNLAPEFKFYFFKNMNFKISNSKIEDMLNGDIKQSLF